MYIYIIDIWQISYRYQPPTGCHYITIDVYIYYRYLADIVQIWFFSGILDSYNTAFPCYMCLCPKLLLGNFDTRHPLRSVPLIEHQVAVMRGLLQTSGKEAANKLSMYPNVQSSSGWHDFTLWQVPCTPSPYKIPCSGASETSTRTLEHLLTCCTTWNPVFSGHYWMYSIDRYAIHMQ